ncbi:hypothetical protein FI667_g15114, partial [Globisporangium splendens]
MRDDIRDHRRDDLFAVIRIPVPGALAQAVRLQKYCIVQENRFVRSVERKETKVLEFHSFPTRELCAYVAGERLPHAQRVGDSEPLDACVTEYRCSGRYLGKVSGYDPKLRELAPPKTCTLEDKIQRTMASLSAKIELSTKGIPINWDGKNWEYYKAMMKATFGENELLEIATGTLKEDQTWDDARVAKFKCQQAKIFRLIMSSLNMNLADRFLNHRSGSDI